MSKEALRDAFIAGWNGGRHGPSRLPAAAFEEWMQKALDGADRSPMPSTTHAPVQEVVLGILCNATNPPKPVAVEMLDRNRRPIATTSLDELKRCAADLEKMESARR